MAFEKIQNLLLYFAGRQEVVPGFFFALATEKLEIVPYLA